MNKRKCKSHQSKVDIEMKQHETTSMHKRSNDASRSKVSTEQSWMWSMAQRCDTNLQNSNAAAPQQITSPASIPHEPQQQH